VVTLPVPELAIAGRAARPKNGRMTTFLGALLCGWLAAPPAVPVDGQRDFDFAIGRWTTRLSRLQRPLTGSTAWVEYAGTTVVRKVWDGRAQLVELDVAGPAGRIEGLSLRLYDPQIRQWSLNFANARGGGMAPPTVGGFADGRGEFRSDESLDGRPIQVRFVITRTTPDEYRYEQAFSADAGKSWEVNWIATDTRVKEP
jgi:hypothetical protein